MKPIQQEQQPQPGFVVGSTNTQIAPGMPIDQQIIDDPDYHECEFDGCSNKAEHICSYYPCCCQVGCGKNICSEHANIGRVSKKKSGSIARTEKPNHICDNCEPRTRVVEMFTCCLVICFWPVFFISGFFAVRM